MTSEFRGHANNWTRTVDVVDFVRPERGEDEVHLDEDRAERQHAAQTDDRARLHEPFLFRNRPRHRRYAARVVRLAVRVSAQQRSGQRQWQDDEEANADHRHHRTKRNGLGRMVVDRDGVHEERRTADDRRQQKGAPQHLLDPLAPAVLGVQAAAEVAIDRRGNGVNEDRRAQQRAALGVQFADDREDDHQKGDEGDLTAAADQTAEQHRLVGRAKHVAVHHFPAILMDVRRRERMGRERMGD